MLSEQPFWWMMAGLIILVTVVVIRMEVQERPAPADTAETAIESQAQSQASKETKEKGMKPSTPDDSAAARAEADAAEMEMFYSPANLKRLCFCFLALNTSMILWGIAQEFIMTNVYVGRNGDNLQIPSALFLVLCNRASAAIFSALILTIRQKQLFFDGCIDSLPPAVSNSLASWCQYSSLSYISFGLQTTAKSTKILPVVIISSLRGKLHSLTDYAECIVLTASCFVFGHESETAFDSSTTSTGLILLTIYIMCDSLTPHLQDVLFLKHKDLDVVQATLAMSCFALAFITAELLLSGALFSSINFIWQCPEALTHMLVLSLASTVTQYMISYTIKHFGPVVYTLIASTRQVLSVLVSCMLFQHDMSGLSIVAMFIIFGTLIVRAVRPLAKDHQELVSVEPEAFQRVPMLNFSARLSRFSPLFVCTMAIHVVYLVYSLLQEFLSSHTFESDLFNFPLTLVALSHSAGALLSLAALCASGHQVVAPGMIGTLLPATTDLVATSLQHAALYLMFFPAQSLMKTLKVLPVMLVGSCLQNRVYSSLDYVEGFLLTCYMKLRPKTVWQLGPAMEPSARDAEPLPLRARGLENENGANHCFLNVVIQAFWNLQSFRRRVLHAPEHDHAGSTAQNRVGATVYCALKTVFQEFQFSDADTLPPDCLRRALSSVYDAQGRFKIGDMEDATETIETILGCLHACNVSHGPACCPLQSQAEFVEEASDFGCHPMCLAHEVFGIEYVDITRCTFCGATREPSVSGAYLYRAYVTELIDCQSRTPAEQHIADRQSPFQDMVLQLTSKLAGQHPATLQEVLRKLCQRDADGKCAECNSRKTLVTERWLTKHPKTFILSLIWPTSTPGREALWLVLAMIQPQLHMDQIFQTNPQSDQSCAGPGPSKASQVEVGDAYCFHGMICYFGMHYVALFWCPARKRWILFDDTSVREKADWNSVTKVMMSGQYLPTLLFYEHVSEDAVLADSLEELTRQVNELEQQPSCAAMFIQLAVVEFCFVAFFVWDFQIHEVEEVEKKMSMAGIFMMFGYLTVDSFTSNFQDHIYQTTGLEPGHMLLGMESISGIMAWILTIVSGELPLAFQFIRSHPEITFFLTIFAMAAAVGAFSCVLTVRLFGPAVFTLIMTSRAIMSLLLSVICFQHEVAWEECLCLIVVSLVMLISSTRRVSAQLRQLDLSKHDDRLSLQPEETLPSLLFIAIFAVKLLSRSGTRRGHCAQKRCKDSHVAYSLYLYVEERPGVTEKAKKPQPASSPPHEQPRGSMPFCCPRRAGATAATAGVDGLECRLCLGQGEGELIAPCRCAGSMRWVHRACLDTWRASGQNPKAFTHCCACGFRYKLRKASEGRSVRPVWQRAADLISRPVQSLSVLPDTSKLSSDVCLTSCSSAPSGNAEHCQDSTDLTRLAAQYVVVDQSSTPTSTDCAEDDSSFCAIALYPFDPTALGGTEPGNFLALGVGQLMQVTHDSRSGWFWGHPATEPEKGGYFPKSHVVSFAAFCKLQRMYYAKPKGL
ncbi:slc35b2 [Symbiodinium microadriaticum]|nr:slc35b2 [Symbiodinium microadriaticum]